MTQRLIVDHLKKVLADTYALYLKTQNYHWNVEGPTFKSLHLLFEEEYTDLAVAIDDIAELIRSCGHKAPGTWQAYEALTTIQSGDENKDAQEMVRELANDQGLIQRTLQEALEAAQEDGDEVVVDALIGRMSVHRKNKWMLEASL